MKLLSGIVVGVVGLVAAGDARTDTRLQCQVTAALDGESFPFNATYTSRGGDDAFTGVYDNAGAGATANVSGAASGGTWTITFDYTDAKHRGWVKKLTGTGQFASNALKASGKYVEEQAGKQTKSGAFTLVAKCR